MDLVVSGPGGATRHLIDVRGVDARVRSYHTADAAFDEAVQEKHRRYGPHVAAFPVEYRGRLSSHALDVLWLCSQEASLITGLRPATHMRSWRRALALTVAFEVADAQRSSLIGHPHAAA